MRIAIVTSSFPLRAYDPAAAAGVFVRDFAVHVAQLGHEVHVLTQDKGWGCEQPPEAIHVHCFPWRGKERPLASLSLNNPSDWWTIWDFIQSGRKALVALHREVGLQHTLAMWAVPSGLFARHLQRRAGVPYSVWCLGSDIWGYGQKPMLKHIVASILQDAETRFADGLQLAADSERLAQAPVSFLASSRQLGGIQAQPVDSAHQGPHFLFVGRYHQVKGVDVLLKAMAQLVAREPGGFLTMLGGGPLRDEMESLVQTLRLQRHVSIGGYADPQTVVDHAATCDAWVIPSRMESIPVVFSDALQLGLPIVASDVGDMGDLLRGHPAGIVVPPGDISALAEALLTMAQQSEGYREAIPPLAAQFDLEQTASRFIERISS
ncbi:MAG: glycosyltransferase [Planctomycetota bacterium]